MNNYEMNKMILEIKLLELRKSAQWWIGGGTVLIGLGTLYSANIFLIFFGMPFLVGGVLVMIKGIFLWMEYSRINQRFQYFMTQDFKKEWDEQWKRGNIGPGMYRPTGPRVM